jgi:diguanylate cyclase (GGDEF)-like protein
MNEQKKNSILIIDDEKSNITALTSILNGEYKVYAVKDSREALETAENDMPDVILLDIIMPEIDGYDVLAALRASEKTRDIPVIFITGLDSIEDEEKGLTLGAADYISKPFHSPIVKLRVHNQIKMLEQYRIIERLGMLDQLTELPNRRNFEARLQSEWGRAMREKTPISMMMIDIDRFKNYNDTYGHQQGDAALIAVAGMLSSAHRRSGDFAARWGGEEFIVLLPNTDQKGALEVAEQLRKLIENMDITCPNGVITKITISIGVKSHMHRNDCTIEKFFRDADEALYEAKSNGRNQVCVYRGF